MKRLANTAAGLRFLSLLAALALPARADVVDGLVARWTFDEAGGATVADSAGSHHGANRGATLGRPGVLGAAAAFRSAEDTFVDLGKSPQIDGNRATVAAFVRPESFNPLDANNSANSRNGILGDADARFIFTLTDQGRLAFIWDAGDRRFQTITTDEGDGVPLGRWSHVAVTRNGSTMMLYIDGEVKAMGSTYAPGDFVAFGTMQIGRVNGSPHRDFDGAIDDLRVYDRALSAAEIRRLPGLDKLPERGFGDGRLDRLLYNHPGLTVDLGVGLWAWPLPMDYDGDGDLDLVVSCSDVPYRGTYFFENPGGDAKYPVFKPGVPIGAGLPNVRAAYLGDEVRVLVPGWEYLDVAANGLGMRVKLPIASVHEPGRKIRANQWTYADYDGDGAFDLIVGIGDWTDYGWDNAFNEKGEWTNGPLHGFVYLVRNRGTNEAPQYEEPVKIEAGGEPIDVYGMPSPCLADFDGDGDLDLICGEFVDKFTWFENVGTRTEPKYAPGRFLTGRDGAPLRMSLCMIVPTPIDWDGDGDVDLVVGQEDGRVALVENTGDVVDGMPVFLAPRFFQQEAHEVKFGALATPFGFDWDNDGDDDILCGNTEGHVGFIENLGDYPPKWAAPKYLEAGGEPIRLEAGYNGSIQGPCETKWGYTTIYVADWDHDGLPDVVANSIWGKVHWYRNVGARHRPRLVAAQPIEVEWTGKPPKPEWNWWDPQGKQLATQWRTTPAVIDLTGDGLNDLVMLDHEGYLALYERKQVDGKLVLLPPKRIFTTHNAAEPLRLNEGFAGRSGRRKLCFVDWDHDGRVDLLVNARNVDWMRNAGARDGRIVLEPNGPLATRRLAGHTTSPTVVDWNKNRVPDLLVGGEDGYFYYLENAH